MSAACSLQSRIFNSRESRRIGAECQVGDYVPYTQKSRILSRESRFGQKEFSCRNRLVIANFLKNLAQLRVRSVVRWR